VTTKDVVLEFLERVKAKKGWEDLLSDDLKFTNFAHPVRRTTGKQASLEGIRRFYAMASALEIGSIIVEGQQACALTRYDLRPPMGPSFESHIAEVFRVENGKIVSLGIYFDSVPYPKPASPTA
jgi:ketosteroid isomerase-like protein